MTAPRPDAPRHAPAGGMAAFAWHKDGGST
jgi:hypothetical protein